MRGHLTLLQNTTSKCTAVSLYLGDGVRSIGKVANTTGLRAGFVESQRSAWSSTLLQVSIVLSDQRMVFVCL